MVVIQPSSGKVLVVNNTERGTWFLPRGRKDIGETLEQCALREAYEEVRYFRLLSVRKGVACHALLRTKRGWVRGCTHVHMHAPWPPSLFVPPPSFSP